MFWCKLRFSLICSCIVHSIRMCFTVSWVLQVLHVGGGFFSSRCACVALVWPILSRVIQDCTCLLIVDGNSCCPLYSGWS